MDEPARTVHDGRCFDLLERIATLAADAVDVEAALYEALTEICAFAGRPIGHASIASVDGLVDEDLWYGAAGTQFASLRRASPAIFRGGLGMVGAVLASGQPMFVPDVLAHPGFLRRDEAAEAGIRSVFAFPLPGIENVAGVVELFGFEAEEPSEELRRVARVVGVELGRMIERARLGTLLRKGEERYRLLFESATDAIFLEDMDGRILSTNPAAERLTGYSAEELAGRLLVDLLAPEWRERSRAQHDLMTSGERAQTRHESVLVDRGGQRIPVDVSSAVVYLNGAAVGVQAVARDLGSRNRAELALRESEERFRVAFDAAAVGMALTSVDGRWLKVNDALCEIVGYSAAELLTMGYQEITHPEDLELDLELGRRMLAGEIPSFQLEKRYVHKDGHPVWVHLSVALVHGADGAPAYSVAQILDLSGRRTGTTAAVAGARTPLTAREREVLTLLAHGATSADVATRLGIGDETVQTHVRRARVKLGAHTRTEAVAKALRLGWLDAPPDLGVPVRAA